MKSRKLNLAMIGLDTSHAPAFTRMLNDPNDPHHLPGGRIVKAWPGGSPDMAISRDRVEQFTEECRRLGVQICSSIEETAAGCDAILLESTDGRVHLEQFKKLIAFRKPVFIDKPLTCSLSEAEELARLAEEQDVPVMSTSSLRFLQGLPELVAEHKNEITGIELRGPLSFQETQPGYFWYGIHTIEMAFAILGPDFDSVDIEQIEESDLIHAAWSGNISARLELVKGNVPFSGTLLCGEERIPLPSSDSVTEPFYYSLLKQVIHFFKTSGPVVPLTETTALINFIEKTNRLRAENF